MDKYLSFSPWLVLRVDFSLNLCQARFPFLDEDVIRILLGFPLWEVANLDQPSGIGDKKILRGVSANSFAQRLSNV